MLIGSIRVCSATRLCIISSPPLTKPLFLSPTFAIVRKSAYLNEYRFHPLLLIYISSYVCANPLLLELILTKKACFSI